MQGTGPHRLAKRSRQGILRAQHTNEGSLMSQASVLTYCRVPLSALALACGCSSGGTPANRDAGHPEIGDGPSDQGTSESTPDAGPDVGKEASVNCGTEVICSGVCTNVETDNTNCGKCDNPCPLTTNCVSGKCE